MKKISSKIILVSLVAFLCFALVAPVTFAAELKIAYVDLRRAFYEYEKSKAFDQDLTAVTTERTEQRNKMVEDIRKMRDAAEMLSEEAKTQKQTEIDQNITELNNYDRDTRQELLNKKNDMFKEVIEDIQGIVENIGKENEYDYVLDSRNIMYSKEGFDLTDQVLVELNKE